MATTPSQPRAVDPHPAAAEGHAPALAAPGTAGAERLLSGWGRTAPTRASVHAPTSDAEVQALLRGARGRGVLARGLGRSYGDAAQNAGGVVLETTSLTGVEWFEESGGRIRARAGTMLETLIERILPSGWFLPVTPGTRFVTLGGAIASDVHGKNHPGAGSFARHVESFELATPTGEVLVARPGDDAFVATAGGMGLTGVILRATLLLAPIESASMSVEVARTADLDETLARMGAGSPSGLRHRVAWVDALARGRRLGRSVVSFGDHAPRAAGAPGAIEAPRWRQLELPPGSPGGLLRRPTVSAFNAVRYARAPAGGGSGAESIQAFFYPLDGIGGWNRLYGRGGLVQHQFVVPDGAEETLRRALELVAASRAPCTLAVLKRLGEGSGLLSFPIPGWTLALDFPAAAAGLATLLDSLDRLVADAGGRVYLTKDGRLLPELVKVMYPELDRWRELRARLDPEGALRSDLSRRLSLAEPRR